MYIPQCRLEVREIEADMLHSTSGRRPRRRSEPQNQPDLLSDRVEYCWLREGLSVHQGKRQHEQAMDNDRVAS